MKDEELAELPLTHCGPRPVRMKESLRSLWGTLREPVSEETRRALERAWERIPERLRSERQFLGRQYAGCGATIGAMPRCDFACTGCYLGEEANRVPAQPLEEIERQLRRIRRWLGEGGNVQLTDGEVTLRHPEELIEMARYASEIGLVPMVMTHGDTFRRDPDLLPRLMREGGLREVSIHIDVTQRNRRGAAYRDATREEQLNPLRAEFAEMIHRVRRDTGLPLDVASTFTVTRDNLDGVAATVRWLRDNAGAFKMISFQPITQVGRTEEGLGGGVAVEELWERIAEGLFGVRDATRLASHAGWLGHPDCSRFVQGVVVREPGREPQFHPLFRGDALLDRAFILGAMERFGGATTRLDSRRRARVRIAGLLLRHPGFFLRDGLRFAVALARRLAPHGPLRFAWRWLRGRARVDYLNIVSHHFMSAAELATERGRERRDLCVFQVPIGDRLVSMCEVNALGIRERYYAAAQGADPMASSPGALALQGGERRIVEARL